MPRIKKKGLDYFPISIGFLQERPVRRIIKHEGDSAVAILLQLYTAIYAGEGYYVVADDLFYEELADSLHEKETEDVRRVVRLGLEHGLFDAGLHREYGVLTSLEVQRQFIYATKRRNVALIDARYNLLTEEDVAELVPTRKPRERSEEVPAEQPIDTAEEDEKRAKTSENVTFIPEKRENTYLGTQSIAQHSIAQQSIVKQSKENPLLKGSPGGGPGEDADKVSAEEDFLGNKERVYTPQETVCEPSQEVVSVAQEAVNEPQVAVCASQKAVHEPQEAVYEPQEAAHEPRVVSMSQKAAHESQVAVSTPQEAIGASSGMDYVASGALCDAVHPPKKSPARTRKLWTPEEIDRLQPPRDGVKRNLDGLRYNLRLYRIPPDEQYAIICKSNYGAIGHPVWKGFFDLRGSHGKIRVPGRYLLSLCYSR